MIVNLPSTQTIYFKFIANFAKYFVCTYLLVNISLVKAVAGDTLQSMQHITISMENVTLKTVFDAIEDQAGVALMYDLSVVNDQEIVSIEIEDASIKAVFEELFRNKPLQWSKRGNVIRILKKERLKVIPKIGNRFGHIQIQDFRNQISIVDTLFGRVSSQNGEPLIGVNIQVKGTSSGTATDLEGNFTLLDVAIGDALIVSYIGYTTREIEVDNLDQSFNIILETNSEMLDEVVVVGYGEQEKSSLTAAVSSVESSSIENVNVANASNALVGRAPGIFTVQSSGEIGADQTVIRIRGIGTTGNASPLIVIDGVPRNSLNELDPSVIESYTILKDAAAVAPYGMAGANGVILIKTKTGEIGKPQFTFNSTIGFQSPTVLTEFTDSYQYVSAVDRAEANDDIPIEERTYSREEIENYRRLINGDSSLDPNLWANTNAYDYTFEGNAPITQHDFTVSGGTKQITYFSGLNYTYQQANYPSNYLNRYGLNTKVNYIPNDKTTFEISINGWKEQIRAPSTSGTFIFKAGQELLPLNPIYYTDPQTNEKLLAGNERNYIIPDAINNGYRDRNRTKVLSQISFERELFGGFVAKGVFSYDFTTQFNKNWGEPGSAYYRINTATTPYTFDVTPNTGKWNLSQQIRKWSQLTGQFILKYSGDWNDHSLDALTVAEIYQSKYFTFGASRSQYEFPIDELNFGSSDKENFNNSGNSSEASQLGYVYRVSYKYKNRYLIETAGRYDGHYYFAPGKRFGFFPSVSLGWRISEEPFWAMDRFNLKIRTSIGQSGNLAGGPAQYLNSFQLLGNSFPFDNTATQGIRATREANPNITWERATKYDIGTDFDLWNGLLEGGIDYFYERRNNMLVNPGSSVPVEYGIGLAQINAGKMKNQGVEVMLSSFRRLNNGIELGIDLNFSYAHNTLLEVFENEATRNDPNRSRTGRPLGSYFGLKAERYFTFEDDQNGDGLITPEDGFPEQKIGGTPKPGNLKYTDVNGDGVITGADETYIGYGAFPEIIYSISPFITWKGFDFNLMLQGTAHTNIPINGSYISPISLGYNIPVPLLDFWTPENVDARWPRKGADGISGNDNSSQGSYNSWFLLNASYLRLKNIELGYRFSDALIQKMPVTELRLYISAVNLFTWTKSEIGDLLDPEVDKSAEGNNASRGWYNPQLKVISAGINIKF